MAKEAAQRHRGAGRGLMGPGWNGKPGGVPHNQDLTGAPLEFQTSRQYQIALFSRDGRRNISAWSYFGLFRTCRSTAKIKLVVELGWAVFSARALQIRDILQI